MFPQSPQRSSNARSKHSSSKNIGSKVPMNQSNATDIGPAPLISGNVSARTRSSGSSPIISNHDSGTNSPLNLPMENQQSFHAAYNLSHGYYHDGRTSYSTTGSSPKTNNIYPTRSYGRSSSLSNVLRERSLERAERDNVFDSAGVGSLDRHHGMSRDRSLERGYRTSHRDKSLERDYPHMGARSLERDHGHSVLRSSSSDKTHDYLPHSHDARNVRDALILELQSQISDVSKECAMLQRENEVVKDKLSSSMNSIKTFWSPELKKERALRKDENARYNMLSERLKMTQGELQNNTILVRELEDKLLMCQNAKPSSQLSSEEVDGLRKERDRHCKEIVILRKTIEEMEIRINTQKQTLVARDESIKKLLEMLQSKGLSTSQIDDNRKEIDNLRSRVYESDCRLQHLDYVVEQKDKELSIAKDEAIRLSDNLKQAHHQLKHQPPMPGSPGKHTMQAMMEAKDSQIAVLEKELRALEDDMLIYKEECGLADKIKADSSSGLVDTLKTKERTLKMEVSSVREELSKKANELSGFKLKFEMVEKQQSEHQQYIVLLKEQISAKELHCSMLQTDIEDMRARLQEKDLAMDKKGHQVNSIQAEKRKQEGDLVETKYHLEIKERRINVLQRKVDMLEGEMTAKDEQLNQIKTKLTSVNTETSENQVTTLEENLTENLAVIERLREQRERTDKEHQEESEMYERTSLELKARVEAAQSELADKQTELCEMREETAELREQKLQNDSRLRQLEMDMSAKISDLDNLQLMHEQVKKENQTMSTSTSSLEESELRAGDLSSQLLQSKVEATRTQTEVDRLLGIMKETENEKNEKEKVIMDQQQIIKEYKQKMGTLKRNQQVEKKKNANLLEEARHREDNITDDSSQLKTLIQNKEDRVEELEAALRESVGITAEREMVMSDQQSQLEHSQAQIQDLSDELDKLQASSAEYNARLAFLNKQLDDKDNKLKRMQMERRTHMEEVYEMKQEAIQAAICEKDATIALLEMSSTKKQKNAEDICRLNQQKEKLNKQLKELTQNRMHLMQSEELNGATSKKKSLAQKLKGASSEQVIRAIRKIEQNKKRLQTLIDQLVAACLDRGTHLLDGLPRLQVGSCISLLNLRAMSHELLLLEVHRSDRDCANLQKYANILLQRIGNACPELLDNFVNLLESSDTESCHST